jgi:hypothetical protein
MESFFRFPSMVATILALCNSQRLVRAEEIRRGNLPKPLRKFDLSLSVSERDLYV